MLRYTVWTYSLRRGNHSITDSFTLRFECVVFTTPQIERWKQIGDKATCRKFGGGNDEKDQWEHSTK